MGKVSINKVVFDSVVNDIKSAAADLKGLKVSDKSLEKTDLQSIKQQLVVIKDFQKALDSYVELLEIDLEKLTTVGNEMVTQDERLGSALIK